MVRGDNAAAKGFYAAIGYEMQDVEVRVEFYPKRKVKKLYTLDNEFIREDPMTWEDMQLDLPITGQDPGLPNPVIPPE